MTVFHPQKYGQVKRYNTTIVSLPRLYVSDSRRNWDLFVQPLSYTYNCQSRGSTDVFPFSMTLTSHPSGPVMIASPAEQPTDSLTAKTPKALSVLFVVQLITMSPKPSQNLRQNHRRHEKMTEKFIHFLNYLLETLPANSNAENIMNYHPEHLCFSNLTNHQAVSHRG